MEIRYFNCGHVIHTEKPKEFIQSVNETLTRKILEQDREI